MKPSFLSRQQQSDLLEHVVNAGEKYDAYLAWCDERGITERFTEAYFPRWVQKHRRLLQARRTEHQQVVRAESVYDRAMRVRTLESSMARLEGAAMDALANKNLRALVMIEEQKRKNMESIAKERGEFNVKPQDGMDEVAEMNKKLRSLFVDKRIGDAKVVNPSNA